jgi:ArpU family phage transcriptional regulator
LDLKKKPFTLPEIDGKETKKRVEAEIENYRICLLQIPEECLPSVTASYSIVAPSNTNAFHSSTESTAIDRVNQSEREKERLDYIERFRKALNRLPYKDRELIVERYFNNEGIYDYEYYNRKHITETRFYRLKARALYSLALALKCEVYKGEQANG